MATPNGRPPRPTPARPRPPSRPAGGTATEAPTDGAPRKAPGPQAPAQAPGRVQPPGQPAGRRSTPAPAHGDRPPVRRAPAPYDAAPQAPAPADDANAARSVAEEEALDARDPRWVTARQAVVRRVTRQAAAPGADQRSVADGRATSGAARAGAVAVIDDDPEDEIEQTSRGKRALLRQPRYRRGAVGVSVAWGLTLVGSLVLGRPAVAALFTAVAALAGWQGARAWEEEFAAEGAAEGDDDPDAATRGPAPVAGLCAVTAGLPAAAAFLGPAAAGGALVAAVLVVALAHLVSSRRVAGVVAGLVVLAALPSLSVVLLHRDDPYTAVFLVGAAGMFDLGTYLVGVGSRSRREGYIAGVVGGAVAAFTLGAFEPEPFNRLQAWGVGAVLVLAMPAGVAWAASVVPPGREQSVWALRRLDSVSLAGPLLLLAIWLMSASGISG